MTREMNRCDEAMELIMIKHIVISSLLVASSILAVARTASAENIVTAAVDTSRGLVYQVDLDNRSEYKTPSGWRHVEFWISTKGDPKKHSAIAACEPYDLKVPYYGWDWLPNGGGYTAETIAGAIARVACNN